LPDQKSRRIASNIAAIIHKLEAKDVIMTAIYSDNGNNKKAILDQAHDYSLRQLTGLPILRLSCTARTANLALRDIMTTPRPES
jgi:hypothetical protein